jgi:hypothetical protein
MLYQFRSCAWKVSHSRDLRFDSVISDCRLEHARYRENAFKAFGNRARVDFIEDVAALPFGLDDLRCSQLMKVTRDH